MEAFVHQGSPARVVFGAGARAGVAEEAARLGRSRALVVAAEGARAEALAAETAGALGPLAAGVFAGARMHTPTEVTARALAALGAAEADLIVAIGGGSAIGLGKALAVRTDLDQIAIPTTYAGSEMTALLGETEDGRKTTRTDPAIRPETVIYDPELTLSLPPKTAAASGLNALAHAIEALYARNRNPATTLLSLEAVRAMARGLERTAAAPEDASARSEALYGAWLCAVALDQASVALHHKLCHVLGGSFDLPHAETHAVVLPHAAAFNEAAVPELLAPAAEALGAASAAAGLRSLSERIGAPVSLRALGMPEAGVDRAADLALQSPYWNPRPFDRDDIRGIIAAAWAGEPPA